MADRAPMKIGSVPATIMVVALVVVAALLYFLTREDPQESDVVAPPVGTESAEPPLADDDTADSVQPQEPIGESEVADQADRPSEVELDVDEGAEPDAADEPEVTVLPGDPVPTVEPETEDPADRPSEDGLDADAGAEPDGAGETDGTARTGDAVSIEPGSTEDTVATTPDPMPAIDQPADEVAELDKPASDPDVLAQLPDTPEMADRLTPGEKTPSDAELDPCVGIRAMTDDADATADGTVPCPDETGAPASETDTAPEGRVPTDDQVVDGASGDGTGEEVAEDAEEIPEPADETGAPEDEADAPESRAPTDGQVADGATGEGAEDETLSDSEIDPCDGVRTITGDADAQADATIPCPDEPGAPASETDTAPESRAPTDGQVEDGASEEDAREEFPDDAGEATELVDQTGAPEDEADAPEGRAPTDSQVADGATGEGTEDETPPESEIDPCDGVRAMTGDAETPADGTVPCPDEPGAPASETDTTPESRVPSDGQVADGASEEDVREEAADDAGEATELVDETGAPASETDTAPESRAPSDGQVEDGASEEDAREEFPDDAGVTPEPADDTGAPEDEADAPESRAPTDGQVADGASGESARDEVADDAGEAAVPVGETGDSTAESIPEAQESLPEGEELEPVEAEPTMEDRACPDDLAEVPLGEVGADGRIPCPDDVPEAVQPDVDTEPRREVPTEPDAGSEKATGMPAESAEDREDDPSAPPEPTAEADEGRAPDETVDAVTPEGKLDVGTALADDAESGDKTAASDGTRKEPADDASEPLPDTAQTGQPASEQLGDSLVATEIDDGTVGDVGSAADLPEEKPGSVPESPEIVDPEAADGTPASRVAEINEDTALEGESPAADPMPEDLVPPSFDLVRVDRFGTTVLAGRAPVDSLVEALVDGEVAGSQSAGRIGQFAMIFSVDTQRDTLAIGLRATLPDGRSVDSDSSVFVVVPHGRMVPVNPVVEEGTGIESIAPVELPTTKLADLEGLQPSVLLATNEGVRLIQPSDPGDEGKLLVEIVSYDEQGEVFIAGSTRTDGGRISIFLNGDLVKSIEISPGGSWWTDLKGVEPGRYRLRVEEVDQSGAVVASVEMPFQKESPEHAREMLTSASRSSEAETTGADQGPIISLLAVQRGFTLWGISRKQYGLGRLYVNIFEANRDQIDNPHLIYPGQIFILPHESQLVDPLW